jgi:hypothetical protein
MNAREVRLFLRAKLASDLCRHLSEHTYHNDSAAATVNAASSTKHMTTVMAHRVYCLHHWPVAAVAARPKLNLAIVRNCGRC